MREYVHFYRDDRTYLALAKGTPAGRKAEWWMGVLLPLILAAWYYRIPIEKRQRFGEHVQWASSQNRLNAVGASVRALPEGQ